MTLATLSPVVIFPRFSFYFIFLMRKNKWRFQILIYPGHIQFYPYWNQTSGYMFNPPTYAYLLTKCFSLWICNSLLQTFVTVSLEIIKRIIIPVSLFQLCSPVIMKQSFVIFKPLKKMYFNNNQQEFTQAKRGIA